MMDDWVVEDVVVAGAVVRVVAGLLVATPSTGGGIATRGSAADLGNLVVILSLRSSSACHPCSRSIHEFLAPPRLIAGQSALLQPLIPFSITSNHTGSRGDG